MKILIVEDEALAVERLQNLLKEYDANIEVLACLESINKTVKWFEENTELLDLILMDIRLSDGLSFDIFKQISINIPVIFITAYDQYAIQAFKVYGVDYLLKPIDYQDIKTSLDNFKARFESEKENDLSEKIEQLIQNFSKESYKKRFLVKFAQKLIPITSQQIAYFYKDDIVFLMTKEGQKYPINYSLDELERVLNPADFFRVNRQFIIQTEAIANIYQYFKGKLKLELQPKINQEIIISQEKSALFKVWLNN